MLIIHFLLDAYVLITTESRAAKVHILVLTVKKVFIVNDPRKIEESKWNNVLG